MPIKKNRFLLFLIPIFLLLTLFLILSPKLSLKAQGDGSPPVLVDFALSTHEVNSDDEDEVTVYVRVSDDSGIDNISGRLRPIAYDEVTNSDTQQLSLSFSPVSDCSGLGGIIDLIDSGCGNEYDGIYSATVAFPYGFTLGIWKVDALYISANLEYADILYADLEATYGVGSATINNIGEREDTVGPQISRYSFNKENNEIDTTLENQTLVLTIHATDDISGLPEDFSLFFYSPGGHHHTMFSFRLKETGTCEDMYVGEEAGNCGDKNNGIYESAVTTIPRWSAKGVWTSDDMPYDVAGNRGTTTLENPISFNNVATIEDIASPTITSLVVDKTKFDTSEGDATITITMELEDDVSGIDIDEYSSGISLRPVFDWNFSIGSNDLVLQPEGTINEGTFKAEIVIPKGSTPGFWTFNGGVIKDNAGNAVYFDMTDYIEEIYLANTALSDEVTIANRWWIEGEGLGIETCEEGVQWSLEWPSITVIFDEGTVVTKQGGGDFGIHRMVSKSYLAEKYANLALLLNEANSTLNTDVNECKASEGCIADQLNSSNLVGKPINIGKVGVPGLGLSFSKPVTIILAVDEQYLGQTLNIQTFDGTKWVEQGSCLVKTYDPLDPGEGCGEFGCGRLVSYPGCGFTTTHASFFSANVLGVETEQPAAGVPKTGLGGIENSSLTKYFGWIK